MARARTCDICGKPSSRIVAKLFLTPINENSNARQRHSEYSGHADVGECCAAEILTGRIKWQKRKSMPRKPKVTA